MWNAINKILAYMYEGGLASVWECTLSAGVHVCSESMVGCTTRKTVKAGPGAFLSDACINILSILPRRVWSGNVTIASNRKPSIFFFETNFNWRIIALNCCVGFCHTTMWISQTYMPSFLHLPPTAPAPSHSSVLSQSMGQSSLCYTAASH